MAGNHEIRVINQDRVDKAEPADGFCNLGNLLSGVRAGIVGARLQRADVLVDDRESSGICI